MAPQWLSCSAVILLLLVHISPVITQICEGIAGIPGIPGTHGPNGSDGPKGEKGDPGESVHPVKGQKGQRGPEGPPGRPGIKGAVGLPGSPGSSGQPGEKGRSFVDPSQQRPLFSWQRKIASQPELDTDIVFNSGILQEPDSQFEEESSVNGTFVCSIKGVYFFTYHISARTRVCVKLMRGIEVHMMLCDYADGYLVGSGSAVLELEVGDTVSLQLSKFNSLVTISGSTSHVFSGFLIFSTA